jgi:hypothetical protein
MNPLDFRAGPPRGKNKKPHPENPKQANFLRKLDVSKHSLSSGPKKARRVKIDHGPPLPFFSFRREPECFKEPEPEPYVGAEENPFNT